MNSFILFLCFSLKHLWDPDYESGTVIGMGLVTMATKILSLSSRSFRVLINFIKRS